MDSPSDPEEIEEIDPQRTQRNADRNQEGRIAEYDPQMVRIEFHSSCIQSRIFPSMSIRVLCGSILSLLGSASPAARPRARSLGFQGAVAADHKRHKTSKVEKPPAWAKAL
jgi:hypothetical protein